MNPFKYTYWYFRLFWWMQIDWDGPLTSETAITAYLNGLHHRARLYGRQRA